MKDKPEFSVVNIYFGMLIPFCIFHYLLETLCLIFNSLYFIAFIIEIIVAIKILMIFYNEMKIWARVS